MEQVTLDDTRITLELARVEGSEALQEEDSAEDVAQVPGVQEIILHQAVGPALLQKRHTELCNLEEQASSSASSEIIDSSRLIVSDKVSSSDPAQPVSVPSGQMPSFSSPPSEQGSFVDVSIEYSSPSPSGKIDMASIQRKLASLQQLRRQGQARVRSPGVAAPSLLTLDVLRPQ